MGILVECPRCKERNSVSAKTCRKCGLNLVKAEGKVFWIEYYDLQKRRRRERVGPSRRAAELRLAEVKRALAEQKVIPDRHKGNMTVSEFWIGYLEWCKLKNSPSWIKRKEQIWRHLEPFFGKKRLKDVTRADIERFRQERIAAGATPAEVNREVAVLKHMFNYAVKIGELSSNPVSGVESLPERAEDTWNPLSYEQAEKLLKALQGPVGDIIAFLLYTGLRLSNALHLRWDQVDLVEKKLFLHPSETKSKKPLVLPLSDAALEILTRRFSRSTSEYVFVNPETNDPYTPGAVRKAFKAALKKAGLPVSIRVHDLRHTFASWALQSGVDIRVLKELLGHSTLEMALRYTHISHKHLLEQVNRIPFPRLGKMDTYMDTSRLNSKGGSS